MTPAEFERRVREAAPYWVDSDGHIRTRYGGSCPLGAAIGPYCGSPPPLRAAERLDIPMEAARHIADGADNLWSPWRAKVLQLCGITEET